MLSPEWRLSSATPLPFSSLCFAGISGANINPAVSFALALTQTISPARAVCYAVAQCLGAISGAGFVRIMTPNLFDQVRDSVTSRAWLLNTLAHLQSWAPFPYTLTTQVDGGANEIQRNANSREALGVEFGCTALLVLVVMAATDSHRARGKQSTSRQIAPIVIGMAVTAAHFIAIPVDNCSINPARSFGVSVISGNFNDHWVVRERRPTRLGIACLTCFLLLSFGSARSWEQPAQPSSTSEGHPPCTDPNTHPSVLCR